MKRLYFGLLLLIGNCSNIYSQGTTPTGGSQEVGVTPGILSVDLNGAATYTIPIAVPPGINGIVPQISLNYSSLSGNGMAGYGWNMGGISSITRTEATVYHDGVIDPVDYDNLDRFSLDGQRLMIKSGTYGSSGAVYETEAYGSNIKVTSYGVSPYGASYGPSYFLVQYPDGSRAIYGNIANTYSRNEWAISYWENPQGARITYTYTLTGNNLLPNSIGYGALEDGTPINYVRFYYKSRTRQEQAYIGGNSMSVSSILDQIKISVNGVGYRNYVLEHNTTTLGYQRLIGITEYSGDNSKNYNPTKFTYDDTPESFTYDNMSTDLSATTSNITYQNSANVTGDFDGDNKMDLILYPTLSTDPNAFKKYYFMHGLETSGTNVAQIYYPGEFHAIYASSFLTGTSTNGYELFPYEGFSIIQTSGSTLYIKTYAFQPSISGPALQYQKSVSHSSIGGTGAKLYYTGDFNGDGLTDVIAVVKSSGASYFINPDTRLSIINTSLGTLTQTISTSDHIAVIDFNGDGKSDLMQVKSGKVNIYSLNSTNNGIVLLATYLDAAISPSKPILIGDYNGDGKADFITATAYGNYFHKFLSTGNSYIKSSWNYEISYNESMVNNDGCSFIAHIIPSDFNGDGKTDLVYVENQGCDDDDAYIYAKYYKNSGTNFVYSGGLSTDWQPFIGQYAQPTILKSDKRNSISEMSFLTNSRIIRFVSNKDSAKESLLRTVTIGNGVKETITYSPLANCNGPGCITSYLLSDDDSEKFPNSDVIVNPEHQVVSLLESNSDAGYKKQIYKYMGAVVNFEGQGFLGFKAISTSNWHQNVSDMVTKVSVFDLEKKGLLSASYTTLGFGVLSTISVPSTFISKTLNVNEFYVHGNKVFNARNQKKTVYDGLKNTYVETTTYYDEYNNPGSIYVGNYLGSGTIQRSHGVTTQYDNQPSASTYYIGRPVNRSTQTYVDAGVMTSEEIYSYTDHLMTQFKKKGHETEYITQDFEYDYFGNVIEKTVSAPGMAARTVSYEYEPTGRFLKTSTDVEGLVTNYTFNPSNGLLSSVIDPYGITTQYFNDIWGKLTKVTDYLGKNETTTYTAQPSGGFRVVKVGDDGSSETALFDNLGRVTMESTKLFTGNESFVNTEYDIYNRVTRVSEPYLTGNTASLHTITEYDVYGRVKKVTEPSGRISNIAYSGLTTTVDDGIKTTVTTLSSLGNIATLTDEGGTISYQYYSNNNLKQSSYDGNIISIEQNGWGQKTKLTDPTAGMYTYQYNNLGELTKEITPKGERTYQHDDFGKLTGKQYAGNNSEGSSTEYVYDPYTKLISEEHTTSVDNNYTQDIFYTYDDYVRIKEIEENSSFALGGDNVTYRKILTYDAFGRTDTEYSYASADGKMSAVTIRNWYQNGYLYKITNTTGAGTQRVWEASTVNERGDFLTGFVGPVKLAKIYDNYGFATEMNYTRTILGINTSVLKINTGFDVQRGNLLNRTYSSLGNIRTETFGYDDLDRLTNFTNAAGVQEQQSYDTKGRITENALGTHEYSLPGKIYQQSGTQLTEEGKAYYFNREGIYQETMEQKSGWSVSADVAFDTAKAFSGEYSLKVVNSTATEKMVSSWKTIAISNEAATNYTISGWVYSTAPAAQIHLVMGTGTGASTDFATTTVTGEWTYISKTVSVPQNITVLSVRLDNESAGTVWFDDIKIVRTTDATTARELNITYNMNNTPLEINETGVDRYSFEYDAENMRVAMFYGSMADKFDRPYQKYYSSVAGNIEVKHNKITDEIEFITYLGGSGYDAPAVYIKKSTSSTGNILYLLRDYQGSIMQIVDASGFTLENRVYDAWGNVVKVSAGTPSKELNQFQILDRGYTGHEHLFSVGLINMNARLYDSKLHRFLSPDNYIQDPFNTQNYNRYGYVYNNPLKYVDPSGNYTESPPQGSSGWPEFIKTAAIYINDHWDEWDVKGFLKDNVSNGFKDSATFVGRNFNSALDDIGNVFDQVGRGIDRLFNGNGPEHYKATLKAPGFSNFTGGSGWQSGGFKNTLKKMGMTAFGLANAFASDMLWGAFRVNPEDFGEYEVNVRIGMVAGDTMATITSTMEVAGGGSMALGGIIASPFTGGTSGVGGVVFGGALAVHGTGVGAVSTGNLINGVRGLADYMARRGNNSDSGSGRNRRGDSGPSREMNQALKKIKEGKLSPHNIYKGIENPYWRGSKEYEVPGAPPPNEWRILERPTPGGSEYGYTKDHYRNIYKF